MALAISTFDLAKAAYNQDLNAYDVALAGFILDLPGGFSRVNGVYRSGFSRGALVQRTDELKTFARTTKADASARWLNFQQTRPKSVSDAWKRVKKVADDVRLVATRLRRAIRSKCSKR